MSSEVIERLDESKASVIIQAPGDTAFRKCGSTEKMSLNANPTIHGTSSLAADRRQLYELGPEHVVSDGLAPAAREGVDALEIFEMVRYLNDPEHPLSLEQLKVVQVEQICVDDATGSAEILFTPTIPHCSMASLIGLSIREKLKRSLPRRFKVRVGIFPGTHASEAAINKQLNDKERVAAALENDHLLEVINRCIAHTDPLDQLSDDGESAADEARRRAKLEAVYRLLAADLSIPYEAPAAK